MPPYAKNHRAQDYPDKDNKNIYFALLDLVPFVQFKNREKHPWRNVTISANLLKVSLLHGCFHIFKIVKMLSNHTKRLMLWVKLALNESNYDDPN